MHQIIALRWKRLRLATSEMGWLIFYMEVMETEEKQRVISISMNSTEAYYTVLIEKKLEKDHRK